ncbi:hypothetical protein Tco_1316175 [Tanacetum coccineum]
MDKEPAIRINYNMGLLKTKFLNKYCPPARTAKKMEEINHFIRSDANYARDHTIQKDCPQKEEGKTLEEAYYTHLEESLTKFMAKLAKRHEEKLNIIKEIRAFTDAAIRNQGASIKTLEIQIRQMSKVLYKDKDEGKSHTGNLIDIPIFVGSFSIILGFTVIDDDDMTKDVVLGIKYCKKYASCQRIMKRFALENNCERIIEDE